MMFLAVRCVLSSQHTHTYEPFIARFNADVTEHVKVDSVSLQRVDDGSHACNVHDVLVGHDTQLLHTKVRQVLQSTTQLSALLTLAP